MRTGLRAWLEEHRGVTVIMALTVVVFIGDSLAGLALTEVGAKSYRIWAGELHRLLLATFLHGGILHLVANLYALYIFGPVTERILGTNRFVVLYVLSGAVGFLVSLLASPGTFAVGASAAIFGLMGYTLYFRLRRLPRRWLPIDTGFLQIFVINFLLAQTVPNIDHWGHVGGLMGGLLCGGLLGFERPVGGGRRRLRESAVSALLLASVFFVGLRPLDAAHVLGVFLPGAAANIQDRYAGYFLPYTVVGATLEWRYEDTPHGWEAVGRSLAGNRYASLSLRWHWVPGVGYKPGQAMPFQVVWRRDGAVVFVAQETVEMPGHYRLWTPPMLGSALAGQWTVEIIAGGHSLAHLRANVRATR
ncbi:MAG: rhomboid family intramembrane serine protease [Firmicutes bacterium]|nr:rhomboid family intramembrane serine protease [Bacillota bacterium]